MNNSLSSLKVARNINRSGVDRRFCQSCQTHRGLWIPEAIPEGFGNAEHVLDMVDVAHTVDMAGSRPRYVPQNCCLMSR